MDVAEAELHKQLTGDISDYEEAIKDANELHTNTVQQANDELENAIKPERKKRDDLVTAATKDKEAAIAKGNANTKKQLQPSMRLDAFVCDQRKTMATWLPLLLELYHQVLLKLEEAPQPWQEATARMRDPFKGLLGEMRYVRTSWKWLQQHPRYLQAIIHRFEKFRTGCPAKDRALMSQVHTYWKDCKTHLGKTEMLTEDSPWENYRWMIEEYGVSLFAQSLGTSAPVSEKRIAAIAAQLKLKSECAPVGGVCDSNCFVTDADGMNF
jgi:hypothetical protein